MTGAHVMTAVASGTALASGTGREFAAGLV
jgi:hypothetical protein